MLVVSALLPEVVSTARKARRAPRVLARSVCATGVAFVVGSALLRTADDTVPWMAHLPVAKSVASGGDSAECGGRPNSSGMHRSPSERRAHGDSRGDDGALHPLSLHLPGPRCCRM